MSEQLSWSFGLRNYEGKYLTVETFNSLINCNSKVMKKKQIFFLEKADGENQVYIRTWANKYLAVDSDGNFSATSEDKSADAALTILPQPDGTWALVSHRMQYIHGSGDKMKALIDREIADKSTTKFVVHLAMHPQVNIKNVNRKRYLHLNNNCITCDENVPWGDDAVLNLDFNSDGSYSIQTAAGTFLHKDGGLTDSIGEDNKFVLEFHHSELAFKSKTSGQYLTCAGGDGEWACDGGTAAGIAAGLQPVQGLPRLPPEPQALTSPAGPAPLQASPAPTSRPLAKTSSSSSRTHARRSR